MHGPRITILPHRGVTMVRFLPARFFFNQFLLCKLEDVENDTIRFSMKFWLQHNLLEDQHRNVSEYRREIPESGANFCHMLENQ